MGVLLAYHINLQRGQRGKQAVRKIAGLEFSRGDIAFVCMEVRDAHLV